MKLSGLEPLVLNENSNFINVGERTNVAGSRKFLRLIKEEKFDEALDIARHQVDGGAQIIDINFDDGLIDGKEAMIRFSSFGNRTPTIFGSLLSLSADAIQDPNTGMTYYLARVEVSPEGMADLGDLELLPGMPAEVFIATGSRTLLQYLFKPFSNAMARSFIED